MLKAVDGTDILQMEVDEEACEHTVGDLLIGKQGSEWQCARSCWCG